jgi:putative hemolysin
VYECLKDHLAEPQFRTEPLPAFTLAQAQPDNFDGRPPKLLRAYLSLGAKVCGPPAIDREFKTIDFLTLMDLYSLHPRARARFMGR